MPERVIQRGKIGSLSGAGKERNNIIKGQGRDCICEKSND